MRVVFITVRSPLAAGTALGLVAKRLFAGLTAAAQCTTCGDTFLPLFIVDT